MTTEGQNAKNDQTKKTGDETVEETTVTATPSGATVKKTGETDTDKGTKSDQER